MFLYMLMGCGAVVLLLLLLCIKLKKLRGLLAVLTLLALLPTAMIGVIYSGRGDLVNYPGDPVDDVVKLFEIMGDRDFANAETRVLGHLGLENGDLKIPTKALMDTMAKNMSYHLSGLAETEIFAAGQTVTLTHMDLEAWLADLPGAVEAELRDMVDTRRKGDIFNADGTDYQADVRSLAYGNGFSNHLERAGDYLTETTLELTLSYTPFGWLVVPDAAFVNTLAGCAIAEEGLVLNAGIGTFLDDRLMAEEMEICANLPFIEKIYTIAEDALEGREPDPDGFGSTTDPKEVLQVVARAEKLLGGQTLSWNPDLELKPDSEIQYYLDDSILAIVWQEVHDNTVCTFSEVKLAHPSQMRRLLSGDEYSYFGDPLRWEKPTDMAKRSKAVVAISGDFYRFRQIGTVVYQREVYRDECDMTDTCFITEDGQWLFKRRKTMEPEDVKPFVEENNVLYSLAFGPVLIDDGEKIQPGTYGVGEAYEDYDRCAVGKIDDLHYLLLTVTREGRYNRAGWLSHVIDYMADKNCRQAYALDGGRSASLVFNGELVNNVNYGGEREMSDIVYFASAIPSYER